MTTTKDMIGQLESRMADVERRLQNIEDTLELMDSTVNQGTTATLAAVQKLLQKMENRPNALPANLTTNDAAELLGVSAATVRRRIRNGEMDYVQIRNMKCIPKEEVVRVWNNIPKETEVW